VYSKKRDTPVVRDYHPSLPAPTKQPGHTIQSSWVSDGVIVTGFRRSPSAKDVFLVAE